MKGWELLKEIAEGNIKKGTKFYFKQENEYCYFNGRSVIYELGEISVFNSHSDKYFSEGDFEIIEEQEELNIQDIEELGKVIGFDTSESIKNHFNKINELIKAIKQLDKQIKENK